MQGFLRSQCFGQLRSLPFTFGVQRYVELTLDAGVNIPGCFAMSDGNDASGLHA
jgi:hypothetical protein